MGVDSYLEIFTTMYGWRFSSVITRMLADTGLIYLPFLFLIVQALLDAHQQGIEGGGVTWLIRRLETVIGCSLFVYLTCVATTTVTSLSRLGLHYTPPATVIDPNPATATGADPQSTYGTAFSSAPDVAAVPAWWYTVMNLSAGISAGVRAGVSAGTRDFRQIEELSHIAAISDVRLRAEIQRFYSECYVPARSRFLRAEAVSPQAEAAFAEYGEADADWIGSHAFRDDPGLYGSLYARSGVPGFPYDAARDTDADPANPPQFGRPSCKQWWEDRTAGLRSRMADAVGSVQALRSKVTALFTSASSEDVADQLARLAVTKASPSYVDPERILGDDRGWSDKLIHAPSDVFGVAGAAWKGFEISATMMPLITLLTMVQPLILMGLYMFLPIVTILSGYNLQVLVLGGLSIFTVKFWSAMWFIARWVDDHLIEAMYPGANGTVLLEALTTGVDGSYKRMILNITLMLMYIGLPLLWTSMMAWAGFRLGQGVDGIMRSAQQVGIEAGSKGASTGKNFITRGR